MDAPRPCVFLPFQYSGNPYLNILDFNKLYIADAPVKKSQNLALTLLKALLRHFLDNIEIISKFLDPHTM